MNAKFMSKLLKSSQNILHPVLFLFPLAIDSIEEFPFLCYCLSKIRAIIVDMQSTLLWYNLHFLMINGAGHHTSLETDPIVVLKHEVFTVFGLYSSYQVLVVSFVFSGVLVSYSRYNCFSLSLTV